MRPIEKFPAYFPRSHLRKITAHVVGEEVEDADVRHPIELEKKQKKLIMHICYLPHW